MDDPRFEHVATDPRFKAIPRRARKVRIDPRFRSMFTEKRFKVKYNVDKRGKKIKKSSSDDLKKYYELEDKSTSEADATNHEPVESKENMSVDLAGTVDFPSSSEDGSSAKSDGEDDEETDSTDIDADALLDTRNQITHHWGEESEGEVTRSATTSSRLAICGMDWDRISAHDLLVLLNSFRPQGGIISSVAIYPSDFGRERMAAEDVRGPAELIEESEGEDEETLEGKGYTQEKLRQYQMNRLKYFYAIVNCDSRATASHIYDQCDGMEYEHSASKLDLRFVPDDVNFDDREPKSVATEANFPSDYAPSLFFTSALQQSKVNLTWDETDPNRLSVTMRKFDKEELLNLDYSAYLASSGDEDNEPNWGDGEGGEDEQIKKYRALLVEGNKPSQENESGELEITWNVGLQDVGKRILKERDRPVSLRAGRQTRSKKMETEEQAGKDLGFNDPFFLETHPQPGHGKKSKKVPVSQEEVQQQQREKEELELLVMSDSEETAGKQHFSLRGLLASSQNEKESKGKKGRKRRKLEVPKDIEKDDDFKVDHSDLRFSALYESHLYAVDPSDPHYKPTSGMKDIVAERQRRRAKQRDVLPNSDKTISPASVDPSIGALVKSVKAKSTTALRKKHK